MVFGPNNTTWAANNPSPQDMMTSSNWRNSEMGAPSPETGLKLSIRLRSSENFDTVSQSSTFQRTQHTCLRRHQHLACLSPSWTVGSEKWTVNEITMTKLTKWTTSCSVLKLWKMFFMSPHHIKLNGPTHTFFSCVTREATSLSLLSSACRRVSWWKWNGQWTTMTSCPKSKASDVPDQQFSERAKGSSRLQRVPTTTKIEWTHTPLLPAWHVHLFCRCLSLWRRLPAGRIVWEV